MKKSPKLRQIKPERKIYDILDVRDKASLIGEIATFLDSSMWNIMKALLAEEIFTHDSAMRTFLKKTSMPNEAAYELGVTEAMEYVHNKMLPTFLETLKTGQVAGLVEQNDPSREGEIA